MPALEHLHAALNAKAKAVRAHHQDRPHPHPGRHAADARPGIRRLCRSRSTVGIAASSTTLHELYELAQGGTAVGTGLNAPIGFAEKVAERDRRDHRPALRHRAQQVRGAGRARRHGVQRTARSTRSRPALFKIANDIRLLGSGPRSGLGELIAAGERAGLLDHAGQGQPDPVRGADHGLRAR